MIKTRHDAAELFCSVLLAAMSFAVLWAVDTALFMESSFFGITVYVFHWIDLVIIGASTGVCAMSGAYSILRTWLWFARIQ